MLIHTIFLAACCVGQTKVDTAHAQNPVFTDVIEHGLDAGRQNIRLPPPRFVDGQSAEAERAALREIAGSERAADDLLRDSVTAPFIIRVHDVKADSATVRAADLWFVVYGELEQIDPQKEASRAEQKDVEVANMWFQTRMLKPDNLAKAGIKTSAAGAGQNDWYVHVHAKLLDRIEFEVTNHVVASKSAGSIVIASRTDPLFDRAGPLANAWKALAPSGGSPAEPPAAHPYAGGVSYAKISRVGFKPGALLVETHMAFVEPDAWFQGAPILRSKFSVAAQDQVRTLRRELMKKRAR
jgi:hypothetical protein